MLHCTTLVPPRCHNSSHTIWAMNDTRLMRVALYHLIATTQKTLSRQRATRYWSRAHDIENVYVHYHLSRIYVVRPISSHPTTRTSRHWECSCTPYHLVSWMQCSSWRCLHILLWTDPIWYWDHRMIKSTSARLVLLSLHSHQTGSACAPSESEGSPPLELSLTWLVITE